MEQLMTLEHSLIIGHADDGVLVNMNESTSSPTMGVCHPDTR